MTNETGVMAGPVADAAPVASAAAPKPTRPFYWCVRRELWENRSIWIAPLITAAFLLPFYVLVLVVMARPGRVPDLPYEIVTSFMLAAMLLVWVFYCVDALHGERRDRSILFWKSLPVSDLTTVLSKAAIPMVVLPIVIFAVTAAMQLALWLAHKATGLMVGVPVDAPGPFPLLRTWGTLLYGLTAMTLWVAPIYGWFLLVSAWARRAALVWALLPFVSLSAPGKVGLLTRFFIYRLTGWATEAFASKPREVLLIDPLNPIAPAKFLSSANLWMGLAVAALLLFAAARLRRRRSPL
jgi:ABC-2 type transport system permease protein